MPATRTPNPSVAAFLAANPGPFRFNLYGDISFVGADYIRGFFGETRADIIWTDGTALIARHDGELPMAVATAVGSPVHPLVTVAS